MALLYLNSPYIVEAQSNANGGLQGCSIQIWIYDGDKGGRAGSPTITLKSTALNPTDTVYIDIAGVCSDYLDTLYDGSYTSKTIWISYRRMGIFVDGSVQNIPYVIDGANVEYITLTGVEGYKFYEEGIQRYGTGNDSVLLTTDIIRIPKGDNFKIPVYSEETASVVFIQDGESYYSKSISTSNDSNEQIVYVDSNGGDISEYISKVTYLNATFEENKCKKNIQYNVFEGREPERVIIADKNGNTRVIKVERDSECLYETVKITYLSRFGVKRDLFFFKKNVKKIDIERSEYKSNTIRHIYETGSLTKHRNAAYGVNGTETLTLNSGYVSEALNDDFRELLLSEKVWITKDNQILPVNVESSSMTYKTHLNDKLINQQIDFKYSYKKINKVR
jgi:predicted metallopeptidase